MNEQCNTCGGCSMVPSDNPNGDVMNTPCPDCNKPPNQPAPVEVKRCVKCGVEAKWSSADCPICFGTLNSTPPAERPTPITDAKTQLMCTSNHVSADFARDLERQLADARHLLESSKRARQSLSKACDHLQRQLAESREDEHTAYLRIREKLKAWDTPIDPVWNHTEACLDSLIDQRDALANALKSRDADRVYLDQAWNKLRDQRNALAEALKNLLDGLDATSWSSWQSTERFSKQKEEAKAALAAVERKES